jgi:MFS family permease
VTALSSQEIRTASSTRADVEPRGPWLPLIVTAMTQVLMSFNVNALSFFIGGIVASFDTSPTTVGTAIIIYSLSVAAFVMLDARLCEGRSSLQTALAIIPYSLSIFAVTVLVLRLFDRLSSRHIAQIAFAVVAGGLALLAVIVRNEWETVAVVFGLIVARLGTGALGRCCSTFWPLPLRKSWPAMLGRRAAQRTISP